MLKIALGTLADSRPAIDRIAAIDVSIPISLRIRNLLQAVRPHLESFDQIHQTLLEKYALKKPDGSAEHPFDAQGNPIRSQVALREPIPFHQKLKELRDQEVSIDVATISVKDLGDVKMPAFVLASLSWFITE